jgi:glycosyltransferase involved in cell wall biosynthesis
MRLAYAATSRIPGRAANAVQVMKMGEALLRHDPGLLMVTGCGEGEAGEAELARLYGLARVPRPVRYAIEGRFGPHLFGARVALAARRRGVDLLLTRSLPAAAWAATLGVPAIYECHAPPQGAERRYWRRLLRSGRFRRLVVISDALRRILGEHHPEIAGIDVLVAHDGVDLARFRDLPDAAAAKRIAGRDPARPVAGYAGHLYEGRGVELILECARARPDWDFLLVGGTEEDVARWRRTATALCNVEFRGFVPNADLAATLAVCDVLLMPYQRRVLVAGGRLDTAQWMSPLKMFEYLAMGRAILSSDLPVLREVLDESCAVLVPPDDPAAWAASLGELRAAGRQEALAAAARRCAAEYDWSARAARILAGLAS